jgi:DNA polymerase, archaea type
LGFKRQGGIVGLKSFQFITAKYQSKDKSILVFATDGKDVYKIKVVGFEPYFYVPIDSTTPEAPEIVRIEGDEVANNSSIQYYGDELTSSFDEVHDDEVYEVLKDQQLIFKHEDGFRVKKIVVDHPDSVHGQKVSIRSLFTTHYEADIPYIRRFLIDTGIHSGFVIQGNNYDLVHYKSLIPSTTVYAPRICYIDWEMESTTRFPDPHHPVQPCTAWTAYCTYGEQYVTCVTDPNATEEIVTTQMSDNWTLIKVQKEETLFEYFKNYLETFQPSVITGWNVKVPDVEYPYFRAREFGIELPYRDSDLLDMCQGYEKLHARLYNRLKDVAVEEGIFEPWELVADEFHKDMRKKDFDKFIRYNKMDVEILVKLDKEGWMAIDAETGKKFPEPPKEIVDFFWNLKTFVGLEKCSSAIHNSVLVDTLHLRKAYGRFVLNSSPEGEGQRYKGAVVFEPPEGIFEDLAVIDMSRYYPNIILGYKIDDLACEVVKDLMAKREEFEKELIKYAINSPEAKLWEKRRNSVKYLLNSTYGYLGSPKSRKYKREKAQKITAKAVEGLLVIRDATEAKTPELLYQMIEAFGYELKHGFRVIYGDTDSLIPQVKGEEVSKLVWYLNEIVLKKFCEKEGIPPLLKLKHEKICKNGMFVQSKKGTGTAKKRYALYITWENGKDTDYIDIVGFDYVRGNASKVTRKLQMNIIKSLLKTGREGIPPYIRNLVKEVRAYKYSISDLAIPTTLSKDLDAYTKTTPYFVKGARWAVNNLGLEIIGGDRIKIIPVLSVECKTPTKVVAFFDEENFDNLLHGKASVRVDYDEVIEKSIKAKAEQILKLAKITWREVEGFSDMNKEF